MRHAIGLFFLAFALSLPFSPSQADQSAATPVPARPNVVPGLTLDEPQKLTVGQKSYLKIKAKADGPVTFDVEAQFEDEGVNFEWERLDDLTVLVAVPASKGVIRVAAVAVVALKPTKFAKTYIEIDGPALPSPSPTKPAQPLAPPKPVGPLHAFFILDYSAPSPANALANSKEMRTALNGQSVRAHILSSTSKVIEEQDLTQYVRDAGGAPALIITDQNGVVKWTGRIPADQGGVLSAVQKAASK
jgi:hypothetical protein